MSFFHPPVISYVRVHTYTYCYLWLFRHQMARWSVLNCVGANFPRINPSFHFVTNIILIGYCPTLVTTFVTVSNHLLVMCTSSLIFESQYALYESGGHLNARNFVRRERVQCHLLSGTDMTLYNASLKNVLLLLK